MPSLLISPELSHSLIGALLKVARVDGIVCDNEIAEINQISVELTGHVDAEELFFSDVGPGDLAGAIERDATPRPYRTAPGSSPQEISLAFLAAARRLAAADGEVCEAEAQIIQAFAEALGVRA